MMDILKAIDDTNLFRSFVTGSPGGDLSSWETWLAFLAVLHGLPIPADAYDLVQRCTGRDPLTLTRDGGFSECLVLCGRRSGKSKMIALCGAAEAVLSGRENRVSAGEIPMVSILSPTRFQSRIIYSYVRGLFHSTDLLKREVTSEGREGFTLSNNVEIAIVTGSPQSARGFSNIACIVDEIASFGLSEDSKVKSDLELIRALRPSLATTGGRLLCVTTPYAAKGYTFTTWQRSYGTDSDILCWNAPSLVMNPTLPPSVVQRALEDDPVAARCEYCIEPGVFREDVDEFVSRAVVESLVARDRKELPPVGGIHYSAFADVSGGRHDDAALAIAHVEGRVVILDFLARFRAPHNPYEVVALMVGHLRRYGCDRALGDAYAAEWTRVAFQSHGVRYERATKSVWKDGAAAKNKVAKSKNEIYLELLPRLHAGELELLDDDVLVSQLAALQRRTRSGSRDVIDHAPGAHDDLANAVAGAVVFALERRMVAGVFEVGVFDASTRTIVSSGPIKPELQRLQSRAEHESWIDQQGSDPRGLEQLRRAFRAAGSRRH